MYSALRSTVSVRAVLGTDVRSALDRLAARRFRARHAAPPRDSSLELPST